MNLFDVTPLDFPRSAEKPLSFRCADGADGSMSFVSDDHYVISIGGKDVPVSGNAASALMAGLGATVVMPNA